MPELEEALVVEDLDDVEDFELEEDDVELVVEDEEVVSGDVSVVWATVLSGSSSACEPLSLHAVSKVVAAMAAASVTGTEKDLMSSHYIGRTKLYFAEKPNPTSTLCLCLG